MFQRFTSAKTSVNSKRLPAIYNKLDWEALRKDAWRPNPVVLDIGAGKYIDHIKEFVESKGFVYAPSDPFNLPTSLNRHAANLIPSVIICSNVLNVIEEDRVVLSILKRIHKHTCPFFITVYVGDKTGIGHSTHNGEAFQRNCPIGSYRLITDVIYKNVITSEEFKRYIKK
jgi:hypothetical protein